MIDPNRIVAEKRVRIVSLEAALNAEREQLRGMEIMAKILAQEAAQSPSVTQPFGEMGNADWARAGDNFQQFINKGRQPGSIAKRWRAALWRLDRMGGNFSSSDIVSTVRELEQREMRTADAKRQMETYSTLGFVSIDGDVFNVTDQFRSKFAESANGLDENEASEADASDTALPAQYGGPQE